MNASIAVTEGRSVLTVGSALVLWTSALFAAVAPAVINGFPLIFWDSNIYISPPWHGWPGTPPFYSAFVFVVAGIANLLAVPFVQAACALVTLELALQSLVPRASPILRAASSLAVVTLTQLPWLASWIMPDLFGGLGIVAVIALIMRRDPPSFLQGAVLSMIALFSAVSATVNVLVLVPTAGLCLLIRCFALGWRTPRGLVFRAVALSLAAIAIPVGWNAVRYDVPRLNVGGNALLFSKLVDSGIAQEYLAANCVSMQHPVCAHASELHQVPHAQTFLWGGDPPLADRLDAWRDADGSLGKLTWDIMRAHPLEILALGMFDAAHLSSRFTLGFDEDGELRPYGSETSVRSKTARFHYSLVGQYDIALQQSGNLATLYPSGFYVLSATLSSAGLIVALGLSLVRQRRESWTLMVVFAITIVAAIVVHGGLVGPYARYHVKISWLASFALVVLVLRQLSSGYMERKRKGADDG